MLEILWWLLWGPNEGEGEPPPEPGSDDPSVGIRQPIGG